MLGKLLKYDLKANALYLLVGYAVYIVLTISFALNLDWIMDSTTTGGLEEDIYIVFMASLTFLWIFSIMAVVLMTYILIVGRFYCNMVTDQGYLTLTLPVSVRMHMLSKLISAVIFIASTVCVLAAGLPLVSASMGSKDFVVDLLAAVERLVEALGASFTVLVAISWFLSMLQGILQVYFAICIGQLCTKHKVWGSIGAYLGISFVINMLTNIVAVVAGVIGDGGLMSLFTENPYSILYIVFQIALCLLYFFGGSWLLEKRANLE